MNAKSPSPECKRSNNAKTVLKLCLLIICCLASFEGHYDDIRHTVPTNLLSLITGPRKQFCLCKKRLVGNAPQPVQPYGDLGDSQKGLLYNLPLPILGNFAINGSYQNAVQNECRIHEILPFMNQTGATNNPVQNEPHKRDIIIPAEQLHHLKIRNVVMITLESTRSDIFPVQDNTRFLDEVYKHRLPQQEYAEPLDATPFAKRLFGDKSDKTYPTGLVIEGAQASSSYTLKSMLASHCGVSPLAVDFMEEVTGTIYKPCLAHILKEWSRPTFSNHVDVSNHNRARAIQGKPCEDDWCGAPWDTQFIQSTIIGYDRQKAVMKMMGFGKDEILSKESLELPTAKYPIPNGTINPGEWSFPETFTIPYIHDLIRKSRASGHRLFLSHLTSTTHYPFRSPKSWNDKRYTEHLDLNNYLNTIAWSDHWIEELFGVLETEEIAEETLVVISGDQ
jgi:hypothetical protein